MPALFFALSTIDGDDFVGARREWGEGIHMFHSTNYAERTK